MAAKEQEREGVVPAGSGLILWSRGGLVVGVLRRGRVFAAAASILAAQLVGQAAGGDRQKPAPRVLGHAVRRPLDCRGEQRLLHRVLAGVEPAVPANQRAEDLRRELAEQVLDAGRGFHISVPASAISGRSSTAQ